VNGKTFEGGVGDIFVIKSGEIHSFKAIGDSPLVTSRCPPQFQLHPREPIAPSARYDREGRVSWRNPAFTLTTSSTTTINLREDLLRLPDRVCDGPCCFWPTRKTWETLASLGLKELWWAR